MARRSKAKPLMARRRESSASLQKRAVKVRRAAFASMQTAGKLCPKKGERRVCGK